MKFKVFFSKNLVTEANSKLARRKGSSRSTLPLEVGDIVYSNHQSIEEIRSAFEAASVRLRKA